MANGHPVAACLARPDIMAAFREAFGYFNTFGGNPVSAAACLAVLQVMREEGLQDRAADTSAYLLDRLKALRHPRILNARAAGLFFGLEFGGEGAGDFTADLVEDMVARGFLLNRIGRGGTTLKMRPPMPFGRDHADLLADALQAALDAA
jgi:4-aminobutyrate aminotransferase-like enzyme